MRTISGLYVHIPFCYRKCFYCDFVSFKAKGYSVDSYLDALEVEVHGYRKRKIRTLYVGGGTPTVLSGRQLIRLFKVLRSGFMIEADAEITVEANPATFDLKKASVLLDLGVNRVSLGIQTFDRQALRWLGRAQSSKQAQEAYELLRRAGFKNISVDLMYGWSHQTQVQLHNDLERVLALRTEHISLYALSVPPGTVLSRRGVRPLDPDTARGRDLFVWERLEQAGYQHYEISNFAKKGAQCLHNLHYWQGGNYIGLGVAAHSHHNGHRYANVSDVGTYVCCAGDGQRCVAEEEFLSARERFWESLLIGLRCSEGVFFDALVRRYKVRWPDQAAREVELFVQEGLLCRHAGKVIPTSRGWLVLDEICARLYRWAERTDGASFQGGMGDHRAEQ